MFSYSTSHPEEGKLVVSTKGIKNSSKEIQTLISRLPYALPCVMGNPIMAKAKKAARKTQSQRDGLVENKDGSTWSLTSSPQPSAAMSVHANTRPYNLVQTYDLGTILTTSTSAATFGSSYFTAGGVDQISSLTAVFDQYRIAEIEVWIRPTSFSASSAINSRFASVIDYDDAANLSSYQSALDYTNCVDTFLSDGHYRRFKPHIAVAAHSGSFTSYQNVEAPWIDCSSTSVQHYGIKLAAQTAAGSATIVITARLHFQFRNIR